MKRTPIRNESRREREWSRGGLDFRDFGSSGRRLGYVRDLFYDRVYLRIGTEGQGHPLDSKDPHRDSLDCRVGGTRQGTSRTPRVGRDTNSKVGGWGGIPSVR